MDVIGTIDSELKTKNYNEFQKLRYIYIRGCQLFYFDSRWTFAKKFDDTELLKAIADRKIDLTNVDNFDVVCRSFAREVVVPLVGELTNLDPKLNEGVNHSNVMVRCMGEDFILDGTRDDLSRLKLNFMPTGMSGNITMPEDFRKTDKQLGFRFVSDNAYQALTSFPNKKEEFRAIKYMLEDLKAARKNFSSSNLFVNNCTTYKYSSGSIFSDRDYNMHKLMVVDGRLYYDLSMDEDGYSLKEIDKDRYDYLTKSLIQK